MSGFKFDVAQFVTVSNPKSNWLGQDGVVVWRGVIAEENYYIMRFPYPARRRVLFVSLRVKESHLRGQNERKAGE